MTVAHSHRETRSNARASRAAATVNGSRMHIAYLNYQYGADTALHHVRQFAAAARALGHRVDVHSMNLGRVYDGRGPVSSRARMREFLKRHAGRYLHEPKELVWNARYFRRELELLRGELPDVLLVRSHLLTVSCVPVASRLGLPLVLEVNAPPAESRLYSAEYRHLPWIPERLERLKLAKADAIVAVSTALKEHLIAHYAVDGDKIFVAPNGADVEMFSPHNLPDAETRALLGAAPVVGFVGSFQKWHGCDALMDMTAALAAARPEIKFLFVGDGPEAQAIRTAAAGDLRNRIVFMGRVAHERVPALVACMDVAVMPESNFYGSPLKIMEWMAAGRAVVGPTYGPFTEVIDDGVHGILFPPRDLDALVRAILKLVDDPSLRARIGSAAAEHVRRSLTWRHNAERVLEACVVAREHRNRALQ